MDFAVKLLLTAALLRQDIVESATRVRRLTVAEKSPPIYNYYYNTVNGHPGAYTFNYDISDEGTGNNQYRQEERYPNGTVTGAYGYVDANGSPQRFRYVADQGGYRVFKDFFKPFYGPPSTVKPLDKFAVGSTEGSVTWTRPKRPNKNKDQNVEKYNSWNGRYNLIGPPSLYVQYD